MNKKFFKFTNKEFTTKRKKFYKMVDILEVNNPNFQLSITNTYDINSKLNSISKLKENYYHIMLDNKKCLSAYQDEFLIPSKQLAIAIASEYEKQKDVIEFNYMPLVKIQ